MKKKIFTAIGGLFCLAILFSACGDDKSSAPSDPREDSEVTTPDSTLSSSEGSEPTSSAIPQSSGSLESSSSKVFLPSSSSWYDGNNYNPGACCPDTIYIEDGKERVHKSAEGVCPPPSIITITCVPPVRVNRDSIKAAVANQKVSSIRTEECLSLLDLLKMGFSDGVRNAKLMDYGGKILTIEFWKIDYCSIDADLSYELSGDTLSATLAEVRSAEECDCFSLHQINIPDTLQNFTYFKFEDQVFGLQ
jgi:hypothetical protein